VTRHQHVSLFPTFASDASPRGRVPNFIDWASHRQGSTPARWRSFYRGRRSDARRLSDSTGQRHEGRGRVKEEKVYKWKRSTV
jgi:hypothetical protein